MMTVDVAKKGELGKTHVMENYKCPLYELRFGTNPYVKRKKATEKQVQARLEFSKRSRTRTQLEGQK